MIEIKHKRTGKVLHVVQGHNHKVIDLSHADLRNADLTGADLSDADLSFSDLRDANLSGAYLKLVDFSGANLTDADLSSASMNSATLTGANLYRVNMTKANLSGAVISHTQFSFCNTLHLATGLESIVHHGPSSLDAETLRNCIEYLPDVFMRGVGYTDEEIGYLHALYVNKAIQYYSCFISYSHKDEAFAQRLHSRLGQANIRVWYAPEDMKSGQKLHNQIDDAIRLHDRLLLVLSEESMRSEWVITEIRKARKAEVKEGKCKLFPIRVTDLQKIKEWECFDSDNGKDLAVEVREYFIPDFSNWKDHDAFEDSFQRLLESFQTNDKENGDAWNGYHIQ